MSEPKLLSPLLDGFALGDPISEHHGVHCCPAIRELSEEKYIVKIVTVPASQAQFDAFLMTGAYKDPADIMSYFHGVAQNIGAEAQFLKDLSRLDGFLPYENWQIAQITRKRLGYEVYLLSPYRQSLEKLVRSKPITHLQAMHLALDLCNACNVCRQAGSLYVDLKPGNIFLTEDGQFRIGDLGFIPMDALSYTTLPEKYQSRYIPPELEDPMASIDLTIDTYALGMILYQLYNEGNFPDTPSDSPIPSPVNADYELSEIILKAIHEDPAKRWQSPEAMAQAIIAYMQRNSIRDTPITPYIPIDVEAQDVRLPQEMPTSDPEDSVPMDNLPEDTEAAAPANADAATEQEKPEHSQAQDEAVPEVPDTQIVSEIVPQKADMQPIVDVAPEAVLPLPEPDMPPAPPISISEEVSKIIEKADDLISHETPVGVILPQIPDPPDPFAFATEDSIEAAERKAPLDPIMEDAPEQKPHSVKTKGRFRSPAAKQKMKRVLGNAAGVALLAGLCYGGFWGYQNFYLQSIDAMEITGSQDSIVVQIQTRTDEQKLQVTCTDESGKATVSDVQNGKAVFSNLHSNTTYSISVDIDGFHGLIGQTSDRFTTDATTQILSFSAVTGPEDGSVVLRFDASGEEPKKWVLHYGIEGQEAKALPFDGHSVALDGLSPGKVYTFVLDTADHHTLSGEYTISYMASRVILADNLSVTRGENDSLTIHWTIPGDVVVDSWHVRCYSNEEDTHNLTVTDPWVTLNGIDPALSYTVEITAAGMAAPARLNITEHPISVTSLAVDNANSRDLKLQWTYTGEEPQGGWLLLYRMDGNAIQNVVRCKNASDISVPHFPGAEYAFTIQAADGTSVFDAVHTYSCPEAPDYSANLMTRKDVTVNFLKTPEDPNWRYEHVGADAFTDTFAEGDPISLVLHCPTDFYLPGNEVNLHYVIRDAFGNVIPEYASEEKRSWRSIWQDGDTHYGELNLPKTPNHPGKYQLNLYVDGALLAETHFTIS